MSRRMLWWVASGAIGVGFAFLHAARPGDPTTSECEQISQGLLRQPVNTVSGLALVIAGLIASRGAGQAKWFGASLVAAGVGSVLSHATLHPIGHQLDAIGVAVAVVAAVALIAQRRSAVMRMGPAVLIAGAGLLVWASSRSDGAWCDPSSIAQGHAIWHLLIASAAVVLVRSTEPKGQHNSP